MGLMVHSLSEIPKDVTRDYYLYLLDYGWKEPISDAIMKNYDKISDQASQTNSVFITGTVGSHVTNEVMSWHHINGEKGEDVFPAILITQDNPHTFRESNFDQKNNLSSKIILIPLNKCCKTEQDVISIISKIFSDIKDKKEITNFKVYKEMNRGIGKRLLDGVILEPNFSGIGFNIKNFFKD